MSSTRIGPRTTVRDAHREKSKSRTASRPALCEATIESVARPASLHGASTTLAHDNAAAAGARRMVANRVTAVAATAGSIRCLVRGSLAFFRMRSPRHRDHRQPTSQAADEYVTPVLAEPGFDTVQTTYTHS